MFTLFLSFFIFLFFLFFLQLESLGSKLLLNALQDRYLQDTEANFSELYHCLRYDAVIN
jgi:hypothetical protein